MPVQMQDSDASTFESPAPATSSAKRGRGRPPNSVTRGVPLYPLARTPSPAASRAPQARSAPKSGTKKATVSKTKKEMLPLQAAERSEDAEDPASSAHLKTAFHLMAPLQRTPLCRCALTPILPTQTTRTAKTRSTQIPIEFL